MPPASVQVPSQWTLVRVSHNKGDNEMILRAVHRSPDINLTAEKNPGNLSYETIDEGYVTSHCLKWSPLSSNAVSRIAQPKNPASYLIVYMMSFGLIVFSFSVAGKSLFDLLTLIINHYS